MNASQSLIELSAMISRLPSVDMEWTRHEIANDRFRIRFRFNSEGVEAWETIRLLAYYAADAEDSSDGKLALTIPLHHTPEWIYFQLEGDVGHCSLLASLLAGSRGD